jgi:plastocyanin
LVLKHPAGAAHLIALAVLLAAPVSSAGTGTIRGRIEIDHPAQPAPSRPNVADLGMKDVHASVPDDGRSVVYLETAPRGAFEDRSDEVRVRMDQRNETFIPHVLAIMTGTTVVFTNSDRTYHNVFSLSRTRPFDLGRYRTGSAKSVRFERPGLVRVFCDIHSHMSAFILVFSHRFFAVTDDEGRFRIENVPGGTYNVVVWNEGQQREVRRLTVPDDGGEVEMNVALGRGQP